MHDVEVLRRALAIFWAVALLFRTSYSVLVLVFMYKPTEHVKAVSGIIPHQTHLQGFGSVHLWQKDAVMCIGAVGCHTPSNDGVWSLRG